MNEITETQNLAEAVWNNPNDNVADDIDRTPLPKICDFMPSKNIVYT